MATSFFFHCSEYKQSIVYVRGVDVNSVSVEKDSFVVLSRANVRYTTDGVFCSLNKDSKVCCCI